VAQLHPAEAARRLRTGELYYRPPGGESWADVALRLRSLLADLAEREAGHRVLLVGHDTVVLMLRYVLEGLDEPQLLAIAEQEGPVRNASASLWRLRRGRLRPVYFNEVGHLADLRDRADPRDSADLPDPTGLPDPTDLPDPNGPPNATDPPATDPPD
jgi:broad specificity phosphatase PhoE